MVHLSENEVGPSVAVSASNLLPSCGQFGILTGGLMKLFQRKELLMISTVISLIFPVDILYHDEKLDIPKYKITDIIHFFHLMKTHTIPMVKRH